ncbi:hypothetical protein BC830DRAFT_164638 [Chytriomyces sp. MP71]|nr:hypothetical protein BC830DRAFT_164638 [Chytriomyces sp. MP71]
MDPNGQTSKKKARDGVHARRERAALLMPTRRNLPIWKEKTAIVEAVKRARALVVVGECVHARSPPLFERRKTKPMVMLRS